jgi:transcriptional regulator with XRE-family HTH domain
MTQTADFQLVSAGDHLSRLAGFIRDQRLANNWTQALLAQRSGVSLASLVRFERSGEISLHSFVKLLMALDLEGAIKTDLPKPAYQSIDDMIKQTQRPQRKRARSK